MRKRCIDRHQGLLMAKWANGARTTHCFKDNVGGSP